MTKIGNSNDDVLGEKESKRADDSPKINPNNNPKPISIKVICVCCQSSSALEVNCSHTACGEGNM